MQTLSSLIAEAETLDSDPGLHRCGMDRIADLCRKLRRNVQGTKEELIARIHEAIATYHRNADLLAAAQAKASARNIPVTLISPSTAPNRYLCYTHRTKCTACSHTSERLETFAEQSLRRAPQPGDGKAGTPFASRYVVHRVPITSFEWNVPVVQIPGSYLEVACCPQCVGSRDLSHLPSPQPVVLEPKRLNRAVVAGYQDKDAISRLRRPPITLDEALDF